MSKTRAERLRLGLIASTVIAAAATVVFGVPRGLAYMTPRLQRVWVVSAALGDPVASRTPREVLAGTPVTLFVVVEALPRFSDTPVLYGTVDAVQLDPGGATLPVRAWSRWWPHPEFLWFKVEPTFPFANEDFRPDFDLTTVGFTDNYQVSWGFDWSHAADVQASGDAYPELDTGTMRFSAQAVVRDWRDRILQRAFAPGGAGVHAEPLAEQPHRVTVRAGDDALGHALGFAGLPYVPTPGLADWSRHPSSRFIAGTVLDFWLLAQRRAGTYDGPPVGWEALDSIADLVVSDAFLANDGVYYWTDDPLRPVDFSTVQIGDMLMIEDHVGVLYEDRGPGGSGDGVLSRWDRAIEAYFEPLRITDLGVAFVSDISILRLRPTAHPVR